MDCDELISKGALIDQLELLAAHEDDWRQSCILGIVRTIDKAPAVDAVEVGSCDGCYWKAIGRQQKCSCCRRNRYLKDCYEGSAKV